VFLDEAAVHEVSKTAEAVVDSGTFILGPRVDAYERSVAAWLGAHHAVATSGHAMAYVLAFRAAGLRAGDVVLVPALGGGPARAAAEDLGLVARTVDVDLDSFGLRADASGVADAAAGVRAIVAVHVGPVALDLGALSRLASSSGALLVEDATLVAGGPRRGLATPGWGVVTVIGLPSWSPLAGPGDGALLVTDNPVVADAARTLRDHGMRPDVRGLHHILGYNARMDEVVAAAASRRFAQRDDALAAEAAACYADAFGCAVTAPLSVAFVVRTAAREQLRSELAVAGIETRTVGGLPPAREDACPNARRLASEALGLPVRDLAIGRVAQAAAIARRFVVAGDGVRR
jgi:dTDP-4-amino-4,6-dideoxygalactose transaminase